MFDNWENEDYFVPTIQTEEQIKTLAERKLVEESDNALTRDLFKEKVNYENPRCFEKKQTFKRTKEKEISQKNKKR
jgi:ribonuclease I